ncbi:hypothetical protein ACN38_g13238 [Penicillium nordicum]|uniref:Uncharacterized protein n=1 Tax=Penicillium nordicum TaxID=229535 RepID=A0A0N0RX79_9EURO|nr:hypothetical protein ACN38_g13238 [Penicillium nordicum]
MNNDTRTIFSEFSDPYRRSLIGRICGALGNDGTPRVKALGLWFGDIKALEVLAGYERNPNLLRLMLVGFNPYNLPRICAYSRGLPRPYIIELISFIQLGGSDGQVPRPSQPTVLETRPDVGVGARGERSAAVNISSRRPARGDRGRSSSPAQASTALRLRSESRIPVPQGRGRRKRIAGDPVSLLGVFTVKGRSQS